MVYVYNRSKKVNYARTQRSALSAQPLQRDEGLHLTICLNDLHVLETDHDVNAAPRRTWQWLAIRSQGAI